MADQTANPEELQDEKPQKSSKLPLILGLILAIVGAGAGFFVVSSGMFVGEGDHIPAEETAPVELSETPSFLPVETLVINLPDNTEARHLLFTSELEVDVAHVDEVSALMPRIVDVLNGYLRSVSLEDLQTPTNLVRLRAQMLHRVQVVVGEGKVKDILIMEFVLN